MEVIMNTSVERINETFAKAKEWMAEGHTGEGPYGHLLRDMRGSTTSDEERDLITQRIKELNNGYV